MLFYETYFKESIISRKPLNWSEDKIKENLDKNYGHVWFWVKCTKTVRKLRKSVFLRNLLNQLFAY